MRELVSGLHFGEAPRWHEGRLWFSDFYSHTVNSVSLTGDLRVELELDDQPSGLGWMPDGSLLVVKMRARQVWRRWPDGRLALHADLSGIHKFLSNDMVVDGQGRAYVGDFGFDLHGDLRSRGPEAVLARHAVTRAPACDAERPAAAGCAKQLSGVDSGSALAAAIALARVVAMCS